MKSRQLYKSFAFFLSLILVISPINFAVSGDFISHADMQHESVSDVNTINSDHHMHEMSASHIDEEQHSSNISSNTSEEDCQSECANCVYCSASNVTSNDSTLMFYTSANPQISKYFSKSIDHSVDIRPPINL